MADLIKKIKIKKQDGTFTNYIPIGAEAQNISTSDGSNLETKIRYYDNNKVKSYSSIEEMKEDFHLKNGDICLINNDLYNIVDLQHMHYVNMTLDNNINKYYLNGQIQKIGEISIENPCEFKESYPIGLYYTNIGTETKIFYLNKSLKSIPSFSCYDKLYFDIATNKFQRQDNVNRITLEGKENYSVLDNTSYSNTILRFATSDIKDNYDKDSEDITIISNRFAGQPLGIRTKEGLARQLDDNGINIFINKSRIQNEDLQGFKEWIVQNPLDVIYQTYPSDIYDLDSNFNIDIILLKNGVYAYQINNGNNNFNEPCVNITKYEKYCTYNYGFKDWTSAFNKALEEKVPNLYLPSGTYKITDTIVLEYPLRIQGDGTEVSIIEFNSVKEDFTGDSIIKVKNIQGCILENLRIWGKSRENAYEMIAGLYIYSSGLTILNNIKVSNINGSGIKIQMNGTGSLASYDCKLSKVVCTICSGHGFWLDATDLFLTQCVASQVWKHGFYFTKSNTLISDCKAYWTGKEGDETTGDGFYLESVYESHSGYPSPIAHKTRMLDCEAQECGRYGFTLKNTDCCQLIGCQSETNGMYCVENLAYGYYLYNNRNLILIGNVTNQQSLVGWIKCPIYFSGGFDNSIFLTTQVLEYESTISKIFEEQCEIHYWNPSNQIIINNNEIYAPDIISKLYSYSTSGNIVDDFIDGSTASQGTSFEIDWKEECQKIKLAYYENVTNYINAKIQKDFNIVKNRFNKIGISVEAKQYTDNMRPFLRVRFLGENDEDLGNETMSRYPNSTIYDKQWLTYHLDGETIPVTAEKIRVELFTQHTSTSIANRENGIVCFKNLKIKFYND